MMFHVLKIPFWLSMFVAYLHRVDCVMNIYQKGKPFDPDSCSLRGIMVQGLHVVKG